MRTGTQLAEACVEQFQVEEHQAKARAETPLPRKSPGPGSLEATGARAFGVGEEGRGSVREKQGFSFGIARLLC